MNSHFGAEIPQAVGAVGLEVRREVWGGHRSERLQHSSKVVSGYPEPVKGVGPLLETGHAEEMGEATRAGPPFLIPTKPSQTAPRPHPCSNIVSLGWRTSQGSGVKTLEVALALPSCVNLGKSLSVSSSQFYHLCKGS